MQKISPSLQSTTVAEYFHPDVLGFYLGMIESFQANTLKKYLLEFESVGRLAAETFEALLVMVEISNGGESLLAQCVDLENFRQYLSRAGLEYFSS